MIGQILSPAVASATPPRAVSANSIGIDTVQIQGCVSNLFPKKVQVSKSILKPDKPTPPLPRPVLLIGGGKSQPKGGLRPLRVFLTSGGNNSFGGVYSVDKRAEFEQEYRKKPGNVFAMRYATEFGSFEHNAKEIDQAVEDIRRLTGADKVDIVAECKAAIDARAYVHLGGKSCHNLVLITPPNKGFPIEGELAWIGSKLPLSRIAGYPLDAEGRKALAGFTTDWSLGPLHGNSLLHAMNSDEGRTREQQSLNSITVISGEGNNLWATPLFPGLPLPFIRGDNKVPAWSAFMPHAQNFFMSGLGTRHTELNYHGEALKKIGETLVTDGHPAKDEHYRARVQSMGHAALEGAAWTTTFVGRSLAAYHSFTAAGVPGPAGLGLNIFSSALLTMDAGKRLHASVTSEGPAARRVKDALNGTAKLVQVGGLIASSLGVGLPAACLIAGGFAVSMFTN